MAIWLVFVIQDPLESLLFLPIELFHTFGLFSLFPDALWAALLTPTGLLLLKLTLIALGVWGLIGFRGARYAVATLVVVGLLYLQVKKGFGGHWDHRELTLVYVSAVLVCTPAWDRYAVQQQGSDSSRRGVYRASLLAMCFVVIVQYLFIGTARLFVGGPGVFLDGTLQRWVENRNLRPNPFGFEAGTYFLDDFWATPLDLLLLGGTILEVAAVLLLFLRPGLIKVGLILGFALFHVSILVLMNVNFPENIALLLLFFDLAWAERRVRDRHRSALEVTLDSENPRAVHFVEKSVAAVRDDDIRVVSLSGDERAKNTKVVLNGVLVRNIATGDIAEGWRALRELRYREKNMLWPRLLWDLFTRPQSGPVSAERNPVSRWFFGPFVPDDDSATSRS